MSCTRSASADIESKRCSTRLSKDAQPLATSGTSEQYSGLNKSSDRQARLAPSERLRLLKNSQYRPARLASKLGRQSERSTLRQSDDVAKALITAAAVVAVKHGETDQQPSSTGLDVGQHHRAQVGRK